MGDSLAVQPVAPIPQPPASILPPSDWGLLAGKVLTESVDTPRNSISGILGSTSRLAP